MRKKVVIIGYNADGVALLKRYLKTHAQQLELVGDAQNCQDGINLIKSKYPDLVLINVEMPDGTGLDVINSAQEYAFDTIITADDDKYAMPAFDIGALHFLCKPISKKKFESAIQRFYKHQKLLLNAKSEALLPAEVLVEQKMKIPRIYGYDIVDIKDIVRLQANGSYTTIHFSSGDSILVSKHLKTYEESLHPLGFVRIQKSHLVNVAYIKSIRKGKKGVVVLKDDTQIYFSSIYKEEILSRFLV